jgi:hypothetical protein
VKKTANLFEFVDMDASPYWFEGFPWSILTYILIAVFYCTSALGQSTAVTVTAQDPNGQVFAGGTVSYTFVPAPNFSGVSQWQNAPLPIQYLTPTTVTLDGTGTATFTIPTSTTIAPAGSQWMYVVCPQATVSCTTINIATVGVTQNISSPVNAAIVGIKIPTSYMPLAYQDSEIQTQIRTGSLYYNTTLQIPKYYDGAAWHTIGSGCAVVNCIVNNPAGTQTIVQPDSGHPLSVNFFTVTGSETVATSNISNATITSETVTNSTIGTAAITTETVRNSNGVLNADEFAGGDIGAKVNAAFATCVSASSCYVTLTPGVVYNQTTQIQIPAGLANVGYYDFDLKGAELIWMSAGDQIQVLTMNGNTPSGKIHNGYLKNNTGNTLSVDAIHQFSRIAFIYDTLSIFGFTNTAVQNGVAKSSGIHLDNVTESWGGYNERTLFHRVTSWNNNIAFRFTRGSGTASFGYTTFISCHFNNLDGQYVISLEGDNAHLQSADMYASFIDIKGNTQTTSSGSTRVFSLTQGGDIRQSFVNLDSEENGSSQGYSIYVDNSAFSTFQATGNDFASGYLPNFSGVTSDFINFPVLGGAFTLQSSPFAFGGFQQARNAKFSWDGNNIQYGMAAAGGVEDNGYFRLFGRVTTNPGDPEVDAAPSSGNKQYNLMFVHTLNKAVGFGPGYGPGANLGGTNLPTHSLETSDYLGVGKIISTMSNSNTDLAGQVTLAGGTGSYSFSVTYANPPICVVSDNTAVAAAKGTTTTTTLTITGTGTDVISYMCFEHN